MGFLKVVKFSTKAVICGGALYYTNEFGIWGNAKETEEGCAKLKSTIQNDEYYQTLQKYTSEYIGDNSVSKQIQIYDEKLQQFKPFGSKSFAHTWNKGVEATFEFLANSPVLLGDLSEQAKNFVGQQLNEVMTEKPQPLQNVSDSKIEGKSKD